MNISFFFMEPFNSPNRGNDILSSASTWKNGGENQETTELLSLTTRLRQATRRGIVRG